MTRADVREANDPWLPLWVQNIWEDARAYYHSVPYLERPSLEQPHNAIFVFTRQQQRDLVEGGFYPPTKELLKWLQTPPKEQPKVNPPDRRVENDRGIQDDLGGRDADSGEDDGLPF